MERLRKFCKKLVGAHEKVIFAVMVAALVVRVVQVVRVGEGKEPDPPPPQKDVPVHAEIPRMEHLRTETIETYAGFRVKSWTGSDRVTNEEGPDDPEVEKIQFIRVKEVGEGNYWAIISVDGQQETVRENRPFARRRARLDKLDVANNKIVFTWLPSNRTYEKEATG